MLSPVKAISPKMMGETSALSNKYLRFYAKVWRSAVARCSARRLLDLVQRQAMASGTTTSTTTPRLRKDNNDW